MGFRHLHRVLGTPRMAAGIVLHLVTRSPFASTALEDALRFSAAADGILLMHDAVLAAPTAVALPQHLAARFATRRLFVGWAIRTASCAGSSSGARPDKRARSS